MNIPTKQPPKQESERPLTRQEKRRRDHVNQEANRTIQQLSDQFMNFFLEAEDPEGEAVVNKMKEISAKWRMYCQRKGLIPAAYPVLDQYMDQCLVDFYKNKEGKNEQEENKPAIEAHGQAE